MPSCPSCGNDLPGAVAFCPSCGVAQQPTAAPVQARRVVSVLFCDLVSFTASADGADVEDVQRRLGEYHDSVAGCIVAFGGVVEKFIGDAVMAVFGAPVAHEDDAERAVRAGLAILERTEPLPDVHVRVGVSTGEVLVNLDARPQVGESFVVGDVVNVAARLQAAAPTDAVVVSAATYRVTDRVFEYAELEPVAAKGKPEPVPLWQALAAKSRLGTDLMRDLATPMVGRSLELATVVNAFDRARAGHVQLVTVVGDAGVGKSRLVGELFAHVEALPELVTWRQGRCLPYGDGVRFWAVAEIVKAHLGVYDGDTDAQVRTKLATLTQAGAEPWVVAALSSLLGLAEAEASSRDELARALQRFVDLMVGDQTSVMVVEDLHWADPALLDFVESLAEELVDLPLLVIGTARPELFARRASWMSTSHDAATIRLTPLSGSETSELIDSRLGDVDLPDAVRRAVVERSGGNPLYAEEFVRMLRDRAERDGADQVVGEIADEELPDTVQALIAARLDTLEPQARRAVHDAAVIGKVVWAGAVASLGALSPQDVHEPLRELVRKEMLRPMRRSSVPGDVEYAFTHVLVRDVAYAQLTRPERASKHAAAVEWIEQTAGERSVEFAEVLSHHAESAMQLAESTGQHRLAGQMRQVARHWLTVAARQGRDTDHDRSWRYITRARELLDDGCPDEADVLLTWVLMAGQTEANDEVWAVAQHVVELRRVTGDPLALAVALREASLVAMLGGRTTAEVMRPREEAVALLRQGPSSTDLVIALADLAFSVMHAGDVERAQELSQEALDLAARWRPPASRVEADALATAMNLWALSRAVSGAPEILACYDEAVAITDEWLPMRSPNLRNNRCCAYAMQVGTAALADLDGAVATCVQQRMELSADWLRSTSLAFRISAGQLLEAASMAEEVAHRFREQGIIVLSEADAAWLEAETERGQLVDTSRLHELVGTAEDRVSSAETQSDEAVIVALGAVVGLVAASDSHRAARLLGSLAGRPVWGFELAPRLARYARAARLAGALHLLPALAELVPTTSLAGVAGNAFVAGVLDEAADPGAAADAFDRAREAYAQLGYALDEAYSRALAGRCRTRLDDVGALERGRAELAEAQRRFAEMGAGWPAQRCGVEVALLDGASSTGQRL